MWFSSFADRGHKKQDGVLGDSVLCFRFRLGVTFVDMNNYLPGTASLLEELDKKLMVLLRDGRTLIGYLRSIDQFANLVLHQTIERIHVGNQFGDIPRGVFVIRGENVVLLGEIDLDKERSTNLEQVTVDEILEAQRVEQEAKQEKEKLKARAFKERGIVHQFDSTHDDF